MKKLLSIILILPIFAFAQRASVKIKSPIFTIVYSEKYQQPLSVQYSVTCFNGTASRKGLDFYRVDSVITSDAADYANNIYDKGHMAPAAAFSCSMETLKQTFSYLNCALQDQDLNRGTWRLLEEHERYLAKQHGQIDVKIDVEFKEPLKKLPTGATVPSGFFKTITIKKTGYKYKFYFANVKPSTSDYSKYAIK